MESKLAGVHPDLVAKTNKLLVAMDALGYPMFVAQGLRTAEYQHQLWLQGRGLPGAIVTNCDGYTSKSNHQAKDDGFGYAVDLAFVDNPSTPKNETWADDMPWTLYGTMAEALGLHWGGRWVSRLVDRPHIELPWPNVSH